MRAENEETAVKRELVLCYAANTSSVTTLKLRSRGR